MRFKGDTRKPVKPELVASDDTSQPVLTKIHLNAEKSEVWVTDSYMLARFPVELDEGDTTGEIPREALKASRTPPLKSMKGKTSIRANSHVEVRMAFGEDASEPYATLPRDTTEYQFPNLERLFPESEHTFKIGLDAAKLYKLAQAMGNDTVILSFIPNDVDPSQPSPRRLIKVKPLNYGPDQPDGLLMPVRIAQ